MKRFGPGDITLHASNVYKTVDLHMTSGSSADGGITSHQFDSGSSNIDSASYHRSLNHLFYDVSYHTSHSVGQLQGNDDSTLNYLYSFQTNGQSQHRNKFTDTGLLINISASKFGSAISSGSVEVRYHLSESKELILRDDGYGNLYPSGSGGAYVLSSSSDTSVSSSENYVGNVFYDHGIITLINENFSASANYTSSLKSGSISFRTDNVVYTKQYYCKIKRNEYNMTTNQTILVPSSSEVSLSVPHFAYYNAYEMPYPEGRKKHKREDYIEYKFKQMNSHIMAKKFKHKDWTPYITKIGLYNEDFELIMVATLPTPVKKSKLSDMTFVVQYDY